MMRRKLLLAFALAMSVLLNGTSPAQRPASQNPLEQFTRLPPEVRLRKLHLVRPDLIQYPISFEVYC
jgi:hypothetical protein